MLGCQEDEANELYQLYSTWPLGNVEDMRLAGL